jgi:precorrin-8X/cobalt-precorrin-8 methylmutase
MSKVGLIIIGHGSRLPHNRENLERLAEMLRGRKVFDIVEVAFMIRNKPTIPDAIESLIAKDVTKIVLVPAFLAHGVHTKQEIPVMIGLENEARACSAKGVELIYGEPLGADERIADIIEEKALKALGKSMVEHENSSGLTVNAASEKMFQKSMEIVRQTVSDLLESAPAAHSVIITRVVHATADPGFAHLLVISNGAIEAAVSALKAGVKVVTDVKMVKAGINEQRVQKLGGCVLTYIDDERAVREARNASITRAAAAMRVAIREGIDGAIVLVGNAPTGAYELAHAVKHGKAKPALIVATPVGFVGAADSKEEIAKLPTPFIITRGRRGGSPVAVAVFNALLSLAEDS